VEEEERCLECVSMKPVSKENIIVNALRTVLSTELNMHSLYTIHLKKPEGLNEQ
jgi:hypothetical protein